MEPESDQNQRGRSRNVSYILPKDTLEGERLDLQHRVFQRALGGNFAVPLDQGVGNILDVGCGTGTWGEMMALDFPGAQVFNVDIDPAVQTNRAPDSAVRRQGMDNALMEQLGRMAEEAGLKGTQLRRLDLPLGSWDPDIGMLMEKNFLTLFEALEPMIRQAFAVPAADYASALSEAPSEWAKNRVTLRYLLVQGQV